MKGRMLLLSISFILTVAAGCRGSSESVVVIDKYKAPRGYNVQLIAHSPDIGDPSLDRRCYYRVFINKMDEGRTDTALDSQKKYFKMSLAPNRHLLRVEKWVLDEKMEKYIKLNNVDQPKPSFLYFDVPENRIVTIDLKVDGKGQAEFAISYEKE